MKKEVADIAEMKDVDMSCLADGLIVPADFEKTGLNLNEIVVGTTGCGKSFSNAYSRLLHTTQSSVVVPIAKRAIKDKFSEMFKNRGYEVIDLDFTNPSKCTVGYDPLDYVHSENDIVQLARNLVEASSSSNDMKGNHDPYWNDSATSVLAALISLTVRNAKYEKKKACFADVIKILRTLKADYNRDNSAFNLDVLFEKAEELYPGNSASQMWKTIQGLSTKTASCILSIVYNSLDKIFSEPIVEMTAKEKRVSFKKLGNKKVALFVTTSPMIKTYQNLLNIFYADMFRELFETAEKNGDGRLRVPVHIVCDDFACGSKIPDFEDYISIFRAAGISVTILLQSESQLKDMYGETASTTIINNCDTYVYMGGMDIRTCQNVSQRANKPMHRIMSMPREHVIVFRRGSEPYMGRRYQTLDDPIYQEVMHLDDNDSDR